MAGIYLHIPFCRKACHYCDFHFSTNLSYQQDMVGAMKKEIMLQKGFLDGQPVRTIYFGGGTPSVLSPAEIHELLITIRGEYNWQKDSEITLEANPDDLSPEYLAGIREAGINRLSIGTQSFHEELLTLMNRSHNATQSVLSIKHAREAGFDNVNMDLIYALPTSGKSSWTEDLERMMAIRPEHLSAYYLTIEPGTVFGNWYAKGKLTIPEEEKGVEQYQLLINALKRNGYQHYEVSNFSLPGKESRHNSAYWKGAHYLGIGPGAHSYDGVTRRYNISHNVKYLKALQEGHVPAEVEKLSRSNMVNEYLLTGLRTVYGIDEDILKDRFGHCFNDGDLQYLTQLEASGKAMRDGTKWVLTESGFLFADKIAEDLFVEDDD